MALEIYSKQRNGADDAMPHFREAFDALQAFVAKKVSLNEAPTAIAFINNVDVSCGDSMTRDGGWTESEN